MGSIPTIALWGLSPEITAVILSIIVGFIYMLLAAGVITGERGRQWNVGPRDAVMPPPGKLGGRLDRAHSNFKETYPYFLAAILTAIATNRTGPATALGADVYLAARLLYIPLYAFGVTGVRTLVWLVGTVGVILIILGVVNPAII